MIALREQSRGVFHPFMFTQGRLAKPPIDVSDWGHATSFNVMVTSPRTPAGALKMSVRLPEWCVANLTVRKSCEGRIRKRSRIQQSIYPTWRIFGIIFTFLGWGRDAFVGRHRSLTAAQAATGFTRNCVLGFTRKRPNFPREARYEVMQSALTARGTLFLYPRARMRVR